jgi:hypothetical protein
VISQKYFESLDGRPEGPRVSDAEIEALFREPGMKERFDQFFDDYRARGNQAPEKQELMRGWGETQIGERRGIAAGIDKQRSVELQIMIHQERLLASVYAQESLLPNAKASDAEIDAYIAQHPNLPADAARTIARQAIEREKVNTLIEEIAKRSQVTVAYDFR